ncbi:TlpA family protein disulfide reductase [Parapedobacter sp. 2B3]|uniref:TlpA family protein disulfide reductase n=1 Tax=Parapedobacter sp. 2B3 TaxID=3342381 RepID=UPI0035B59126
MKSIIMTWLIAVAGYQDLQQPLVLEIGDKAPRIEVGRWVSKQQIGQLEHGKYYIVTFSSEGCPPCLASIPIFTELSDTYGGKIEVVNIYLNTESKNKTTQTDSGYEKPKKSRLETYINNLIQAYGINYPVGIDQVDGATQELWNVKGVPTTYVVDRCGEIIWRGHMPAELNVLVPDILSGRFDRNTYAIKKEKHDKLWSILWEAYESGDRNMTVDQFNKYTRVYPDYRKRSTLGIYRILAFTDAPSANNHIKWALDNLDNFSWSKLANYMLVDISMKKRNISFELLCRVLDRNIQHSKSESQKLKAWHLKSMYVKRIAIDRGDPRAIQLALETTEKAIQYAILMDNQDVLSKLEEGLDTLKLR